MSEFISLITSVLAIELNLGSVHMTLGGVLLGYLLVRIAVSRLFSELSADRFGESISDYESQANDLIRARQEVDTADFWNRLHSSSPDEHGFYDGQNF
jgi:hypothetical protein